MELVPSFRATPLLSGKKIFHNIFYLIKFSVKKMNIAFITISVNPNSPSGSLDYFSEMASQLPTLDKDNNYIFIINLLTKRACSIIVIRT